MKRLAIIPARGGSKRIPKKNIRLFHGRPMILWVLEQIRASDQFDVIHVSTDDKETLELVSAAGFSPEFMRNPEAATDSAPLSDVKRYVLEKYSERGFEFDIVGIFFATAVFLDKNCISDALKQFEINNQVNEMISVTKFSVPIEWALKMNGNGILLPVDSIGITKRSQDLPVSWHETGEFVLYKEKSFTLAQQTRTLKGGYSVNHLSVDIDTPEDLVKAEQLFYLKNHIPL
ncbi:cytidylyltransferase domain-containing protein [Polynucleobacter necessarius]|uniref:acylneuraminate cytidylyltransferase family protein n=1 Tax=Polynucleobacter necessarius TaxID=576610 RepID=UPI000E09CBF6|nr:acylneuraminate cytidylyltransferase family protein [Polynucleobacter necessarius]